MATKTTEQFIKEANSIHKNKYNYSKTNYINAHNKITIICPEHGMFKQFPTNHLSGNRCQKCSNTHRPTTEEFIQKAQKVHDNRYDYSKVNYKNSQTKVTIICSDHGEFEQTPSNHLQGTCCWYCGNNYSRSNTEEFIKRAKQVHSDKYDYSKVNYINANIKVTIICKKHGEFEQKPDHHLNGSGCSMCKASKGELALEAIFKKHNIEAKPQYKLPEIVSNYEIDFYLPEYNLLIEFHGIQHYEYRQFLHKYDEDNFLKQKNRDDAVRDNARRWKYNYLEFNYKQFEELSKEKFEELVITKIKNIKVLVVR